MSAPQDVVMAEASQAGKAKSTRQSLFPIINAGPFQGMGIPNKIALIILLIGTMVTSIIAFSSSINKPFTLDETDITIRAHYINIKGAETFLDGTQYIAHPPMYEYIVALLFKTIGEREVVLRGFGVLLYLMIGWAMVMTLGVLLKTHTLWVRQISILAAILLYVGDPLLIQHAMIIDGDTTGTAISMALFVWGFVAFERSQGVRFVLSRIALGLVIALMFWSKEITPFLVAGGVVGYRLINREWKRLGLELLLTFVGGACLGWAIWSIYCWATGVDLMAFVEYTLIKKTRRAFNLDYLGRVANRFDMIMRWPTYWASVPFYLLLVTSILWRISCFIRTRSLNAVDVCWVMGWCVWFPYLWVKPSMDMMKYQYPIYPAFLILMIYFVASLITERQEQIQTFLKSNRWFLPSCVMFILGMTFYYYKLGDYIYILWDKSYMERWRNFLNGYYRPLFAGLIVCLVPWIFRKYKLKESIAILSIIMMIPIHLGLSWNQTASYTTGVSWMNYGESGHRETAQYIVNHMTPNSVVMMRKDIQYYVEDYYGVRIPKQLEYRQLFLTRQLKGLEILFRARKPDIVVIDPIAMLGLKPELIGPAMNLFVRYFYLDKQFGTFKIYRPRQSPT